MPLSRRLLLAVVVALGALCVLAAPVAAQAPTPTPPPTQLAACTDSIAVPDAVTDLTRDCAWLLYLQAELVGTATLELNWSKDLLLTDEYWDGIGAFDYSPPRPKRVRTIFLTREFLTRPTRFDPPLPPLTGTIPKELANLTALDQIYLWQNELTGPIPPELGTLTELTHLNLSQNRLSGAIPDLSKLTKLQWLYLWGNRLTGPIPTWLGDLRALTQLSLSRNQLTGTIPAELGDLTALTRLYLNKNRLSGAIPDLSKLTALQYLYLWGNRLTGPIPTWLGDLTALKELSLSQNRLSGEIPDLSKLTALTRLYLNENQLTGAIPTELGSLTALTQLYLWGNQLSGEIPTELGDLTALTRLYLNENQLSGGIPTELGQLTALTRLSLNHNELTGPIPTWLGSLTALEYLYLDKNELSGAIPATLDLSNLTSLKELGLSCNELSGEVPAAVLTMLGQITTLEKVYLQGNAGLTLPASLPSSLTGKVVTTGRCRGDPPPAPATPATPRRSSSSSSTRQAPAPTPVPQFPVSNQLVTISERQDGPGQSSLVFQRHDRPEASFDLPVGWISQDGTQQIPLGFVRDESLGQTYAVLRRAADGLIVRWWIPPDSPWVYVVPWPEVNTRYTVPLLVLVLIPLDEQYPWPNQLVRRFDGGDDRILAYDAAQQQWRHVPDLATFQARGYYWCDVTAADGTFFTRLTIGPAYPARAVPARADYPSCRT